MPIRKSERVVFEQEASVGSTIKMAAIVVGAIIGLWLLFHTVSLVKIEGDEAVVRQTMAHGVEPTVWLSGTHVYCGWVTDIYKYKVGTQKITFDEHASNKDAEYERIVVDCGENGGQKAWIAMSVNYRLGWERGADGAPRFSPEKLVKLHKDGLRENYESVILKRTVVDVVNKIARPNEALSIYSGKGFVDFKEAVDAELKSHPVFKERGIFIENTIIYKVYLDPTYEKEIAAKVLAIQTKLRKVEETKAAEEEAKRVFAESQANVEKVRQDAEASKIKQVKAAEAKKEQDILAAEAEKQKRTLEAEGDRDANLARASGILAVGKAEAEVDALKREALYGGKAGEWRARVEIANQQALRLKGLLEGVRVVPERTILSLTDKELGLVMQESPTEK